MCQLAASSNMPGGFEGVLMRAYDVIRKGSKLQTIARIACHEPHRLG